MKNGLNIMIKTEKENQTRNTSAWLEYVTNNSDEYIYVGENNIEKNEASLIPPHTNHEGPGKAPFNSTFIIYDANFKKIFATLDKPMYADYSTLTLISYKKGYPDKIVQGYTLTYSSIADYGFSIEYNGGNDIKYKDINKAWDITEVDPNDYGNHQNYCYNNFNRLAEQE